MTADETRAAIADVKRNPMPQEIAMTAPDTRPQEWNASHSRSEQRAYLCGWNDAMAASIRRAPQPLAISRRERIATAAMQGMLVGMDDWSERILAQKAVSQADALIAALDEGGEA